jgi:O-antigen/teichoic acid export membrane protein
MAPLLVVSVVNLVSVPLFYRYLGVEMYALWLYITTFTGLFGFADLGLGVAVGRYVGVALGRGDQAAVQEYWNTGNAIAIPLLAGMGLLFAVLGVVFGPRLLNVSPGNVTLFCWCFVAGGAGLFISFYGQFWNILLQAHLDFRVSSLVRIVTGLLQVIPAILLAWATGNPLWIILWTVLVGGLQLGLLASYSLRHFGLGLNLREARWARVREMAAYTGKTFATLLANATLGSIDRVVLGKLASTVDFAHYTICTNVGTRLQTLGSAVMGPVFFNTNRTVGNGNGHSAGIFNEMFHFTFAWYLLASVWAAIWHRVLLRLWLGQELAIQVGPVFTPLIIAFCLTTLANISGAQLASLNRLGTALGFTLAAGTLAIVGVYVGWRLGGVVGVAYGFLGSRVAFVIQDVYVIRLIKAGGWFSARTWVSVAAQGAVGAALALAYLVFPRDSLWLIAPAILHGGLVGGWLLREPIRKFTSRMASLGWSTKVSTP